MAVLVGCGGGTAATADGGGAAGGVATSKGGASGNGGGAPGAGGAAGAGADTDGAAGTIPGAGGSVASGGTAGSATGAGGAAGAATGGHAAGGIGGMNCRPDILIVQDRSGSMNNDDNDQSCNAGCGANSKWSQVTTAITNVVGTTSGMVNWGIKFFPNNSACDASAAPTVGIAASNGAAVADTIARTQPGGNTPTRDAITYGMAYLQSLADSNPKYLLLATDGLPNCPIGCAPLATVSSMCTTTDDPSEDLAAEMAVAMAATAGMKTFVVGIGNVASAANTLNQLALAGGEPEVGATYYYTATDEADLELSLNRIVNTIAGCPH